MTERTPPATDADLLDALDRLDDSVPIEKDEVGQVLAEAAIDPRAELVRALAVLERAEARERANRFARAETGRRAALRKLSGTVATRSRSENLARLRQLQAMVPTGSQMQANFKNFETASDDDLDRIVAEFEHLLADKDDE
jgi:hypothetical protein